MNTFYVYALFRENGVPFYIGKGQGDRWLVHEYHARATKRRDARCSIIRRMQSAGRDVPKIKLHEGLTEATACAYEIALIAAIGRDNVGPLVNLTDGGEGKSGWVTSPETRAKIGAANRGRIRTPEAIEKTAVKLRGRKLRACERIGGYFMTVRNRTFAWQGGDHGPRLGASVQGSQAD